MSHFDLQINYVYDERVLLYSDRLVVIQKKDRKEVSLYAHTLRSILGAADHIILTPLNQLLVRWHKISSMSNLEFEPATFQSLAERANQLRYPGLRCHSM
jgi:hypothetical protein